MYCSFSSIRTAAKSVKQASKSNFSVRGSAFSRAGLLRRSIKKRHRIWSAKNGSAWRAPTALAATNRRFLGREWSGQKGVCLAAKSLKQASQRGLIGLQVVMSQRGVTKLRSGPARASTRRRIKEKRLARASTRRTIKDA